MSLTKLLKNDELIIKLFSTIPDLKTIFKTLGYHNEVFPKYIRPLVNRNQGANPSTVGTAYDFWFRAYLQRLNKINDEKYLPSILKYALHLIQEEGVLYKRQVKELRLKVERIWMLRNKYIAGENINENHLLYGCVILSHCEAYYRSKTIKKEGFFKVLQEDYEDMINLASSTKQMENIFKTNKKILLNPTFGTYSGFVDGADADFTLGKTIFDIKTTAYYGYKKEYIWQLVGYYLLSEYDTTFPIKVEKIAIYYARFNKIIYVDIDDIRKLFNLDLFSKYFKKIIVNKDYNKIKDLSIEELKEKMAI